MASVQHLRGFIRDRLTAAAEEIFSEFEKTILQYEEMLERQRTLQQITWSPVLKLHMTDLPQQHACTQEELLTAQQLCNQERNSSPEQENPESPQIKGEREELCSSQEGEPPVLKQETDTVVVTLIHEESDHSDPEPDGDQLLSHSSDTVVFVDSKSKAILQVINKCIQDEVEINHQCRVLDRTWNPVVKLYRTDLPQQHVRKQEEVLTDQQLCNQERNSSPERENPDSPQIKGELCSSQQQQQQLVQTQEADVVQPCSGSPVEPIVAPPDASALSADSYPTLKTCKKLYPCNTCGKTFTTMFSFKRHSTIHTGEKPHLCTTCGRRFRQIYPLTVHMRTHTGELPYICSTCGKGFKEKVRLRIHMHGHTGEKPHLCTTCGRRFRQIYPLTVHMRSHTGELPYICNTCGKGFKEKVRLRIHMHGHTGERPHLCNTCGKKFRAKGTLNKHMRIHSKELTHICSTCGKRFRDRRALKRHGICHTGEKPHVCVTCGKRSRDVAALKRHMKIHTGEQPYLCNTCGKKFIVKSALQVHMRTHTGEQPYLCHTCGKRYKKITSLKVHMQKHT